MIAVLEFSPRGIPAVTLYVGEDHLQVVAGKPAGVVIRTRRDLDKQRQLFARNAWALKVLDGIDRDALGG